MAFKIKFHPEAAGDFEYLDGSVLQKFLLALPSGLSLRPGQLCGKITLYALAPYDLPI
jgi:hypothetical protein